MLYKGMHMGKLVIPRTSIWVSHVFHKSHAGASSGHEDM